MLMDLDGIAALLGIPLERARRWLEGAGLPAEATPPGKRWRREEVLAWAAAHGLPLPPGLEPEPPGSAPLSLAEAVSRGGIFLRVEGDDREGALHHAVQSLRLPAGADRSFLLQLLLAREELASTALGGGIAVPHARNPWFLELKEAMVSLHILARPVPWGALDGQPIRALFLLLSPTVRTHLHLLGRLSHLLQRGGLREAILGSPDPKAVLAAIQVGERGL